jgi:hypothetical protein
MHDPELHDEVERFLVAASGVLAIRCPLGDVPSRTVDQWRRAADEGYFERGELDLPLTISCISSNSVELKALPEYSASWGRLSDLLARTHNGLYEAPIAAGFDPERTLFSFLASMFSSAEGFSFISSEFEGRYALLESALFANVVPAVALAPLSGFSCDRVPLQLTEDLCIDRFTDDEIPQVLEAGFEFKVGSNSGRGIALIGDGCGVRARYELPWRDAGQRGVSTGAFKRCRGTHR